MPQINGLWHTHDHLTLVLAIETPGGFHPITRGNLSVDVYKVIVLNNGWQKTHASHDQRLVGMFNESECNTAKID